MVVTGMVEPPPDVDWYALRWHLAVWDPYFLVWGVLLGVAVRHYQLDTRRRDTAQVSQ